GSIEQDADVVIFVYRESYYLERARPDPGEASRYAQWQKKLDSGHGKAELIVAKVGSGPTGTAHLAFDEKTMTFATPTHGGCSWVGKHYCGLRRSGPQKGRRSSGMCSRGVANRTRKNGLPVAESEGAATAGRRPCYLCLPKRTGQPNPCASTTRRLPGPQALASPLSGAPANGSTRRRSSSTNRTTTSAVAGLAMNFTSTLTVFPETCSQHKFCDDPATKSERRLQVKMT